MTWRDYHESTKHTRQLLSRSQHFLDWIMAKQANSGWLIEIMHNTELTLQRMRDSEWPAQRTSLGYTSRLYPWNERLTLCDPGDPRSGQRVASLRGCRFIS
jgi:hypothetical protein